LTYTDPKSRAARHRPKHPRARLVLAAHEDLARCACAWQMSRFRTTARLARALGRRPTERIVHDVRVACRRMREALAFFEGVEGVPAVPKVERAARRMARAVRRARELAVAMRTLRGLGQRPLVVEAERTRRALLAALRRPDRAAIVRQRRRWAKRAARLEHAIAQALPELRERSAGRLDTADPGVRRWLERRLASRQTEVVRRLRELAKSTGERRASPCAELHRIRVAIKHWRYAGEIAAGAVPGHRRSSAPLATLRRLQDLGGRAQDFADLAQMVREAARALARGHARGAPALLQEIEAERARAAAAFVDALRKLVARGRRRTGTRRQKS